MKEKVLKLLNILKEYDDKRYLENFYSFLLAPTITGVKPSSILTIKNNPRPMHTLWPEYGCEYLGKLNLSYRVLRSSSDCSTLLIFSEENLKQHISRVENREYLYTFGYEDNFEENLTNLCKRYSLFIPHECGIFLGIPAEDVEGYIYGKECLLCGYWKAYGNCRRAVKAFQAYDRARALVMKNIFNKKEFDDYCKHIINIFKVEYR